MIDDWSCPATGKPVIGADGHGRWTCCGGEWPKHKPERSEHMTASGTDLTVTTSDPKLLHDTLQQLPGASCAVVDGSFDGKTCIVRVFGDADFIRYAINNQGYGEVIGQQTIS